jgi:hypothetical protein
MLPAGSLLARLPLIGIALAVVGIAASGLGYGADPEQFYHSWLVAFAYFLSIALGGLFFVMAHFVTKAGWGVVVRRTAENMAITVPLLALAFVPVVLGMHDLYHWTHADAVEHDALIAGKAPFLNSGFFIGRAVFYFLCWSLLALWYRNASVRQDSSGDPGITRRLTAFAGPGIIVFALTVTFAAFDWLMSLDPHWYSTIYGVYFFAGCLVGAFAFLILVAVSMNRSGQLRGVVTVEHFHDLGKLLFAFTVFWSYIAFSQFFLIWYGNIPEETAWYLHRMEGSWRTLTMLLAVGHFFVPFFFLMPRTIKRRTGWLTLGAVWMAAMHLVDVYWLVMPSLHHEGVQPSWMDLTTLLAVGGLFLAGFGWALRAGAVVPLRDPRLIESLSFQNF